MSHLILNTVGSQRELNQWRTYLNTLITNGTLKVHLFNNNYTPLRTSVLANFTEATFNGYLSKAIPNPFGAVFLNGSNQAEMDGPDTLTWHTTDNAVPNTIYGYYVHDLGLNELLWAERFDAGADMTVANKYLNLIVRFTSESKF